MRIVALFAVRNEERFIGAAIRHLAEQGVESYVIDNESTDRTRQIVESLRGRGVIGVEVLPHRGVFHWAAILRRKEQLHCELAAHWYIHHDGDMILQAPNPHRTLAEGIAAVDRAGANAIDFDEFVFMPIDPADDHDNERYLEDMRHYVYLSIKPTFRVIAWKNIGQRVRLDDGGHRVAFHSRRIHPEPFILRHYLALSADHAVRKYAERRYAKRELACGWHGKRATLRRQDVSYPEPGQLRPLSGDNTWDRSCPVPEEPLFARAQEPTLRVLSFDSRIASAIWRRAPIRRGVGRLVRRVPVLRSLLDRSGYPSNRVVLLPTRDAARPLRNVLILGSGRSGTSMVAGLFRNTGYFMGFDMLGSSPANLYGYYEDTGITEINNLLLRWILHWWLIRFLPLVTPAVHRDPSGLWLAAPRTVRRRGEIMMPLIRLMDAYARQQPFCYKDPRFSVTLPLWERFLPIGTRRIVVFRHPDRTVDSVLLDARETYDPRLPVSVRWAYTSWYRNYGRLLRSVERGGPTVFVNYDDVASGAVLPMLAWFTNAAIDATEVDRSVSRSAVVERSLRVATRCRDLYAQLCARARTDLQHHGDVERAGAAQPAAAGRAPAPPLLGERASGCVPRA